MGEWVIGTILGDSIGTNYCKDPFPQLYRDYYKDPFPRLYRDYYKDPFPHSLLSTSTRLRMQTTELRSLGEIDFRALGIASFRKSI